MLKRFGILVTLIIGMAAPAFAQGTIMPAPVFTGFTNAGAPCASCKLYTYVAGTTTPLTTYSDPTLAVPNANPVVLDSAGRASVFLSSTSYKFVLKTAAEVTLWTADNIGAVPTTTVSLDVTGTAGEALTAGDVVYLSDGSGSLTAGRWYKADSDNTYSSITGTTIGIVTSALTSGSAGTIRISGRSTGLTGLTAGTDYYISATAGGLTSSAPTNARFVGRADSTTSIVIGNELAISSTPQLGRLGIGAAIDSSARLKLPAETSAVRFGSKLDLSTGTQAVTAFQAIADTDTVAIQLTPHSATLVTDGTYSEYVLHRTPTQAFGGNYSRLSLSATTNSYLVHQEVGGTWSTGLPIIFSAAHEDTPTVFTDVEWMRFQTNADWGEVIFGLGAPHSREAVQLTASDIGSAGQRDSPSLSFNGKANDGTERGVHWKFHADVTSNAGASALRTQQYIDGGSFATVMSVDNSGRVGIGTVDNSLAASLKSTASPRLIVSGSGVEGSSFVLRHTTPGNGGALLDLGATRGSGPTSYTAVQSGDGLGSVTFHGADGDEFVSGAAIMAVVDGTPGNNDLPTRLVFSTTVDGGSSPTERMRLDSGGNMGLGATSFGTNAAGVFGLVNNTAPTTSPADMIQIFSVDAAAGEATLGLRTEATVASEAVTSDRTLKVVINGTVYKILLDLP